MPRALPWLRLYTEARTDKKLAVLTLAERGVWVNLLCYAAEQETRGTFDASDRFTLAVECADADEGILDATLAKLVKIRHLVDYGDGRMTFRTFDVRQQVRDYRYPSEEPEAVRARVAKSRASRPANRDVTSGNDSLHVVTGHVTSVTSGNDLVTSGNDHIEIENRERDHDHHEGTSDPNPFAAASDDARRTGGAGAVIDISLVAPSTPPGSKPRRAKAQTSAADDTAAAPPAPLRPVPGPVRVNPLWDALHDAFGYEPGTAKERSNWGRLVKELKAAQATPEDVHARCAHHRAGVAAGVIHWTLTPNALVSHWGELGKAPLAALPAAVNGHRPARAAPASRERPMLSAADVARLRSRSASPYDDDDPGTPDAG